MEALFKLLHLPSRLISEPDYKIITEARHQLYRLEIKDWLMHDIHRWTFFFNIFWTIFPLWIWWRYTDRNRFLEISFFGTTMSILAGILDTAGAFTGLWQYPDKLVAYLPNFFPIDYVTIPVVFMLIYQKYNNWKSFTIANITVSGILAFIGDPILIWLNLYEPLRWNLGLSFITFILMASAMRWVSLVIIGQDFRYRRFSHGK